MITMMKSPDGVCRKQRAEQPEPVPGATPRVEPPLLLLAGAQYDRKMGAAAAPAPAAGGMMHHHHPWAMAPGPGPHPHPKPCEDHNPQTDADLLFILSANQVNNA